MLNKLKRNIKNVIKKQFYCFINPFYKIKEKIRNRRLQKYAYLIDVEGILKEIQHYTYVLTKMDVPYMPGDFPVHIPIEKDMDMICAENDFSSIVSTIRSILKMKLKGKNLKYLEIRKSDKHILLRIEESGKLFYQFDIACYLEGIEDSFIGEMLGNRVKKKGYYIPTIEDELIIRVYEIMNNPSKIHHIDFVKTFIQSINKEKIVYYLGQQADQIVSLCEQKKLVRGGVFAPSRRKTNRNEDRFIY